MTNHYTGTLYVGVTSDLPRRVWLHRNDCVEGFTRTHALHRLVWFEMHDSMYAAISREKQLKKWNREWKLDLVNTANPQWRDLWEDIAKA